MEGSRAKEFTTKHALMRALEGKRKWHLTHNHSVMHAWPAKSHA
jgi:hypothetical protein